MFRFIVLIALLSASIFLIGCAGPSYTYRYVPGRTAALAGAQAIPPPTAPAAVVAAIDAGNRIAGAPYARGGGHGHGLATAFDCSGAVSYVLQSAGLLSGPRPSTGFRRYGDSGEGEWISVYARRGHVFLVVAGLRFDTGWTNAPKGPQWTMRDRSARGSVIRHPPGL